MSELKEYKCPACGGAMEFDSELQKMKCPYCDTVLDVEEFEEKTNVAENASWEEGETDNIRIYSCDSCGGEIVAEDTAGAVICPFCGSKIVVKKQFEGDLKPDYVIPFKLDKKAAKEAYHNHLNGKPFLPRIFKSQNHIDEIRGVYVPFWLYSFDAEADITYDAEKTRIWRTGNKEYTEHSQYRAFRSGNISFTNIPEDGSEKMDDALMESVEPYDFNDAVPFKAAYLAGYMADRYDVAADKRMERAVQRSKISAEDSFMSTVKGYDFVKATDSNINIKNSSYKYALYPVWILNTTWKENKYVFAMNGQTGKMVGNLPVDKGLFWKYIGIRTPIISVIVFIALTIFEMI